MPPLQGALSLSEMDDISVRVCQDLKFDVPGVEQQLLQVDIAVAEGGLGLAPSSLQQAGQLLGFADLAHALAAATGGRLDQQWVADFLSDADQLLVGKVAFSLRARDDRDAGRRNSRTGDRLVAHRGDRRGAGANEDQPGVLDRLGKIPALGEEAVAGMNGASAAHLGDLDDAIAAQVGFLGGGRAEEVGFIGVTNVKPSPVGLREDAHRPEAEFAAGSDDADGDLPTVGDQDLVEHAYTPSAVKINPYDTIIALAKSSLATAQRGMFPCFFGGFESRLFESISSALISLGRVRRGSITASR